MDLKAAFRATAAASVVIIVAACGGGASDSSGSSATASASPAVALPVPSSSGSTSTSSRTPLCQPVDATTFIGGNLFVAEQGPIGVTLLSDGGMGPAIFDGVYQFGTGFMVVYDNVFGMQVSNSQDKFGFAKPFPPGTQVGASTQVHLQPPQPGVVVDGWPLPSTFPKGIPLELTLAKPLEAGGWVNSSTADIRKDNPDDEWHRSDSSDRRNTASVIYGPNNTATVTFFAGTDGPHFSVGLTNVFGTGCPK